MELKKTKQLWGQKKDEKGAENGATKRSEILEVEKNET